MVGPVAAAIGATVASLAGGAAITGGATMLQHHLTETSYDTRRAQNIAELEKNGVPASMYILGGDRLPSLPSYSTYYGPGNNWSTPAMNPATFAQPNTTVARTLGLRDQNTAPRVQLNKTLVPKLPYPTSRPGLGMNNAMSKEVATIRELIKAGRHETAARASEVFTERYGKTPMQAHLQAVTHKPPRAESYPGVAIVDGKPEVYDTGAVPVRSVRSPSLIESSKSSAIPPVDVASGSPKTNAPSEKSAGKPLPSKAHDELDDLYDTIASPSLPNPPMVNQDRVILNHARKVIGGAKLAPPTLRKPAYTGLPEPERLLGLKNPFVDPPPPAFAAIGPTPELAAKGKEKHGTLAFSSGGQRLVPSHPALKKPLIKFQSAGVAPNDSTFAFSEALPQKESLPVNPLVEAMRQFKETKKRGVGIREIGTGRLLNPLDTPSPSAGPTTSGGVQHLS